MIIPQYLPKLENFLPAYKTKMEENIYHVKTTVSNHKTINKLMLSLLLWQAESHGKIFLRSQTF